VLVCYSMFEPQNPFEESLVRAIDEPAHRGQFYRDFLAADLYVGLHGPAPPMENGRIKSGTGVHIQGVEAGGKTYLAVFSSLPRLRAFLEGEPATLRLACRDLLEMIGSAELMLNPGSDYGKEFVAEEIAALLDGSMFQGEGRRREVASPTQVLLGQPAQDPRPLTDALRQVYEKRPEVQAAYVAWMVDPGQGEAGALLVAIDTAGDWDPVSAASGEVAQGFAREHGPVDFVQLEPDSSLWGYFRNVRPFYRRPSERRSFWRSLFSR
jgi:hypothetical protein